MRCYNANYANCTTTAVSSPISQTDAYTTPAGGTARLSEVQYNGSGLVTDDKEYDFGAVTGSAPGTTKLVRETSTTYGSFNGSGCTALTNGINSEPCQAIVKDWSAPNPPLTIASTSYSYDQTGVTATSGTPQHVSVSGSRGNLTTIKEAISGSASLTKTFTYYDTGTPNVITEANGAQTTYVYGSATQGNTTISCGNSLPTKINEPLSLFRSITWNCTAGVVTQVTDENGNNVTSTYSDPDFWRPGSFTDQMNNQTSLTYIGETAVETALQNFNGGNSGSDFLTTIDGFGRPIFSQRRQSPTSTIYDTVEIDYSTLGRPSTFTMPYTASASPSSSNTTVAATTKTYDALGRVLSITDGGGGVSSFTYTNNDVLQRLSGTQAFQRQLEYDGLGRLTSVCEVSSTVDGSGTCGQTNQQAGLWTQYAYDALGHLLTVTQNAQAATGRQIRTITYDMLGRRTSESNPETGSGGVNGTVKYVYDSATSTCNHGSSGDLIQKTDNAGNVTCYTYDGLHRLLTQGNSAISGATLRKFVYDSNSATPPSGWSSSNAKTHLIEASTTNTSGAVLTDEWFMYDARGELTDVFELTPHSGGYYHTTAAYWPTGTLKTLSGIPGVPTINYGANGSGLDGEGRITQVSASSGPNPVTNVTYLGGGSGEGPLGALRTVTFGSSDSDTFTYGVNTGRLIQFSFSVNGATNTGALTWNKNWTLAKLIINDQIPGTSDSQTCNYVYDDLQRLSSANCGALWTQNFSYDAFGNITKSVPSGSNGLTFAPTYTFGSNNVTTNQFASIPGVNVQYDTNGNLLTDNLNTYTWDPTFGTLASVTPAGGTTATVTYDAFGDVMEEQIGSTVSEILYSPVGKIALMNGTSVSKAFIALPAGATAIYTSTGLAYYRHSDWLGSSRLASTQARALYSSTAYAPFGEQYTSSGSSDPSFTGQNSDTVSSLYDFALRRLSMSQGRWISPDPAGLGAVDLTKPQTWNRYTYVINNPLGLIDLLGESVESNLVPYYRGPSGSDFGGFGGGPTCNVDGIDEPCDMVGDSAVQCPNNDCGPVPIFVQDDPVGFAIASYGADGSISYSFSFGATYGGVQLTDAAIAEILGLPTSVSTVTNSGSSTNNGQTGGGTGQCVNRIVGALHQVLGNFTATVTGSRDAGIGTATNIYVEATGLSASQFNALMPGARWSLNSGFGAQALGLGPSLHIANPESWFDGSFAQFFNQNNGGMLFVAFTAHIDDGNPNRPLGFFEHLFVDLLGGNRPKC
ncbi:MAG TPA: RHS repeat-associated core domain-containing protein [Candidatus Sulfotelmatobacter sp.]|nr:RHS repeat-associated core domain-containing protein [Candidatus Sulfotelmatobacter sp.]